MMEFVSSRTWKGYPVFDCPECAFDTLEKSILADHFRKVHTAAPAPSVLVNPRTNRRFAETVDEGPQETPEEGLEDGSSN